MTQDTDPYTILGVSPDTPKEKIDEIYQGFVKRLHPDNNSYPEAHRQFEEITAAYKLLASARLKREFDEQLADNDDDDENEFIFRLTPSKRTMMSMPESQVIYLLADISPTPNQDLSEEEPTVRLNLTLVLDRSNSMKGSRIEKVKIAAHRIIDDLSEDDFISVIAFNDRAEVVIAATPLTDKPSLKAKISLMAASGGTEIFKGLSAGAEQARANLGTNLVNHMLLLTDGNTYGDQDDCLALADQMSMDGIGISTMGLGHDWNDAFLDDLASKTGGSSVYINSANAVVRFMNDHVRNLTNAFAERVSLSIAPESDVSIESAFRLSPHPQPLTIDDNHSLLLGRLQFTRPIVALIQFQMPSNMLCESRHVARLIAEGNILSNKTPRFQAVGDIVLDVVSADGTLPREVPPTAILDALSKLTLYRLQERAKEALDGGDVTEATRRLENLATRLLDMGQDGLANQALSEARRVAYTRELSDRGRKTLKYQTRLLLDPDSEGN
jgi:Ca-activated chloride channel homolog